MMKIGDCKMVKFSDVKVGTFFQVDGREWYKHASGWGHACLAGFNKRFAKDARVRLLGSRVLMGY